MWGAQVVYCSSKWECGCVLRGLARVGLKERGDTSQAALSLFFYLCRRTVVLDVITPFAENEAALVAVREVGRNLEDMLNLFTPISEAYPVKAEEACRQPIHGKTA